MSFRTSRPIAPCLDCKDRTLGCHSTCEPYKEFRLKLDAQNERNQKEKEAAMIMHNVIPHYVFNKKKR